MTAYGDLAYFAFFGLLAAPAVILGLMGRRLKFYGMLATVIGLLVLLVPSPRQLVLLLMFLVGEVVVAKLHLSYVAAHGNKNMWERRAAVLAALIPLAIVKLTGLYSFPSLGFIGVSYLTFRAVQVVLEISDKLITELRTADYLYFVAFFPTLSSGPIDRSRRFLQDADRRFMPGEYHYLLGRGLWYLVLGGAYKFALATVFASWLGNVGDRAVDQIAYMYLYGFQLFFDFAGYSLMAVGASHIFGIRTPQNFRLPFVAESIKDFWNRWHITLSFWFRDYLYTRLFMALLKRRVFSNKIRASHVALMVNMGAMGLWHGTSLHYILYGLYHGALLILTEIYERRSNFFAQHRKATWYRVLAILVTFHLVFFGFLLFSGHLVRI